MNQVVPKLRVVPAPSRAPSRVPDKARGVADIVFLFDLAPTSRPALPELQRNVARLAARLAERDAASGPILHDVRIKLAAYRAPTAHGDSGWLEFPFAADPGAVGARLKVLEARHGAAASTPLLDALERIAGLGSSSRDAAPEPQRWRPADEAERILVFFTGAVFAEQAGSGRSVDDVIRSLTESEIVVVGACPEADPYVRLASLDRSEFVFVGPPDDAADGLRAFATDPRNFDWLAGKVIGECHTGQVPIRVA